MRVIRSPHAHARFEVGDLAAWRARWPGVVDVITAADVPRNAFAIFPDLRDQPVLADGVARFRGEALLALVGDAEALAALPVSELPIRYTPLPAHEDGDAALAAAERGEALHARYPDNVLCRGRVVRGDVDAALASAAFRAGSAFETRHVEHAYIEPEAGYAEIVAGIDHAGAPLRASASSPARRRPTWTATRSPACSASRPSRCTSCRRRSAAASAASSTSRCSRCWPSPPGSWAGRPPGLRAAGVDAVEHQAASGANARAASPATPPAA